jgi:hypothetical protein
VAVSPRVSHVKLSGWSRERARVTAKVRPTWWLVAAFCLVAIAPEAQGQEPVDLELVLAVDTSGSVDAQEFALQIHGIAKAFRDPEVHAALPAIGSRGIAVTLVQWAGRRQQVVAVDWMVVRDERSASIFASRVATAGRWILGETAIADALAYATQLIETNGFDAPRRTIDISGDGVTNAGTDPDVSRDAAVAAGVTINGLAIVNETPDLDLYYRDHVVGGDGAFLIIAKDYQDFAEAIRRKLIDEIRGAPMSRMPAGIDFASREHLLRE